MPASVIETLDTAQIRTTERTRSTSLEARGELSGTDRFQEQDKPEKQYAEAGLDAAGIVDTVLKALRVNSAGIEEVRA